MKVPTVLRIKAVNQKNNRLELLKNIYGQKKSGRVWNKYLVKGLLKIDFEKSDIDQCVFSKVKSFFSVLMIYAS